MLAVKILSFSSFYRTLPSSIDSDHLHLCEVSLKDSLQKLSDGQFLLVLPVHLADCVYSRRRKI